MDDRGGSVPYASFLCDFVHLWVVCECVWVQVCTNRLSNKLHRNTRTKPDDMIHKTTQQTIERPQHYFSFCLFKNLCTVKQ